MNQCFTWMEKDNFGLCVHVPTLFFTRVSNMTSVFLRPVNQRKRKKNPLSDEVETVSQLWARPRGCCSSQHCGGGATQRPDDRNEASSRKPSPGAVRASDLLNVIRPSTAGYTRFMSETYLEKTEMSMSPERGGTERLVVIRQAFSWWWSASACRCRLSVLTPRALRGRPRQLQNQTKRHLSPINHPFLAEFKYLPEECTE